MKSDCRDIGCYNDRISLIFDRHLGSTAAEVPANLQSDWKNLNMNLEASRLHEILRYDVCPLIEWKPGDAFSCNIADHMSKAPVHERRFIWDVLFRFALLAGPELMSHAINRVFLWLKRRWQYHHDFSFVEKYDPGQQCICTLTATVTESPILKDLFLQIWVVALSLYAVIECCSFWS